MADLGELRRIAERARHGYTSAAIPRTAAALKYEVAFDPPTVLALLDVVERQERVLTIAEHLFQMVPQEVWREHGEQAFGMYEGDYHAEQVRDQLAEHRDALARLEQKED